MSFTKAISLALLTLALAVGLGLDGERPRPAEAGQPGPEFHIEVTDAGCSTAGGTSEQDTCDIALGATFTVAFYLDKINLPGGYQALQMVLRLSEGLGLSGPDVVGPGGFCFSGFSIEFYPYVSFGCDTEDSTYTGLWSNTLFTCTAQPSTQVVVLRHNEFNGSYLVNQNGVNVTEEGGPIDLWDSLLISCGGAGARNTPSGTNVKVDLGTVPPGMDVSVEFEEVKTAGNTGMVSLEPSYCDGVVPGGFELPSLSTCFDIETDAVFNDTTKFPDGDRVQICLTYDPADLGLSGSARSLMRLHHDDNGDGDTDDPGEEVTSGLTLGDMPGEPDELCGRVADFSLFLPVNAIVGQDYDGDNCPNEREAQIADGSQQSGGRRSPSNPWDYFNPTKDGRNRIDDVLAVVRKYFLNQGDQGYSAQYDRTYVGPNLWNLGPPNGQIRIDDVLAAAHQYFHDCG